MLCAYAIRTIITLIFSYIRRLGSFFWVQILNFNIFWGFQNFFWFEDFVDFLGVITKLVYILWSFLYILGSFLKVKVQSRGYFWGCQNFKYLFGVLEIPDIFWSER